MSQNGYGCNDDDDDVETVHWGRSCERCQLGKSEIAAAVIEAAENEAVKIEAVKISVEGERVKLAAPPVPCPKSGGRKIATTIAILLKYKSKMPGRIEAGKSAACISEKP